MVVLALIDGLRGFAADDGGVTAIEYALLASLIAVAIVVGLQATGTSVLDMYVYWSARVTAALST